MTPAQHLHTALNHVRMARTQIESGDIARLDVAEFSIMAVLDALAVRETFDHGAEPGAEQDAAWLAFRAELEADGLLR